MVTGASEALDLRTGTTIWQAARRPRLRVESLTSSIDTDVVVVGAGISGALIAERLAVTGFRVAIVDRRGPCLGSTVASTSLLQFEIDTPLLHLGAKIGAKRRLGRGLVLPRRFKTCSRVRKNCGFAATSCDGVPCI